MKRIAIKIGSNVLSRADGKLDITQMSALVEQIAGLYHKGYEIILVSSGAVAAGRGEIGADASLDEVSSRQLYSAIGQAKLINRYYDFFREQGIRCGQVLTQKESFSTPKHYETQRHCMEVMLAHGVIPIVNENDTISITELMFTDNDELAGLMAEMMHADELVILSNVDGIYTGNPSDPASRLISEIRPGDRVEDYIQSSKSAEGRGGMASKAKVAMRIAEKGIPVVIQSSFGRSCPQVIGASGRGGACGTIAFGGRGRGDIGRGGSPLKSTTSGYPSGECGGSHANGGRQSETGPLAVDTRTPRGDGRRAASGGASTFSAPSDIGGMDAPERDEDSEGERPLRRGRDYLRSAAECHDGCLRPLSEERQRLCLERRLGRAGLQPGVGGAHPGCVAAAGIRSGGLYPASSGTRGGAGVIAGLVDLVIPRGGKALIRSVREQSRIPVIETGAGVCHTYFDAAGDVEKGQRIILNAKTRRVSVCNALDCLLIHRNRLVVLPELCRPLADKQVVLYADKEAFSVLQGHYPKELLQPATDTSFGTEFLDYKMSIRTVGSLEEAVRHINRYGSRHSECIVSEEETAIRRFEREVDAACVYANVATSFTDGAQFGFGAEIGISTQKLHARGPMALPELTTYKYIISGNGQIRT